MTEHMIIITMYVPQIMVWNHVQNYSGCDKLSYIVTVRYTTAAIVIKQGIQRAYIK
jgi:hypothetical protein